MKISYSAPAKVIISGEHAVVYGKPALVSAINLRLIFTILERSLQDSNLNKEILFISQKVKDYLNSQNIKFIDKPFSFKIKSDIPVGRGLGSSAALSTASVATFLEFYTGKKFDKKIVNDLAFEIEKYFHSNPSGVDNTASCFGGLILFKKNVSLKKLSYKITENIANNLFLIDSGKPEETTGEMVEIVGIDHRVDPSVFENIISKIEVETKNMEVAIKKENINLFKNSLIKNEILLEKLGVVSKKTKELIATLSKFGVGKVTGAGGRKTNSGFILFLAENKKELENFLMSKKINYYQFTPDYQGLKNI